MFVPHQEKTHKPATLLEKEVCKELIIVSLVWQ